VDNHSEDTLRYRLTNHDFELDERRATTPTPRHPSPGVSRFLADGVTALLQTLVVPALALLGIRNGPISDIDPKHVAAWYEHSSSRGKSDIMAPRVPSLSSRYRRAFDQFHLCLEVRNRVPSADARFFGYLGGGGIGRPRLANRRRGLQDPISLVLFAFRTRPLLKLPLLPSAYSTDT